MSEHIHLGKAGEEIAAVMLAGKGYRILERNWRFGKEEIDIIARDGPDIVIIEVKTRSSNVFAEPEASVTKAKQRVLVRAANAYVNFKRFSGEVRFDIVSILLMPGKEVVNHIQDAFYATRS
ncbi:MAG TPA: YraN family protein [Bacteroidales bacterium]|nr:YraN family protein [Bacteroidales bacterium]HPS61983.1 YraN family protein [Bacteroidales bacterium]